MPFLSPPARRGAPSLGALLALAVLVGPTPAGAGADALGTAVASLPQTPRAGPTGPDGADGPDGPALGRPAAAAPRPTGVTWQNEPVAVALKVGAERRVDFPEPIADLDVPKELERQSQIVLSPAGQLFWTARAPFAPARVLATSVGGTLYQLDVAARPEGEAPGPLAIADPVLDAAAAAKAGAPDERAAGALLPGFLKGPGGAGGGGAPNYAALARFALAHYTGPARLIPALENSRVKVEAIDARALLRVQSADLAVRPLAQWKIDPYYVTAVGVYNRSAFEVPFEPRALRGELRFAAALHPALGPAGGGHSGTVWIVVTDQPFNRAVSGHASAFDPLR